MGQLVKQLVENTYSERVKITDDPLIHKEAHFAFSFQIESDTVYEETKKKTLASIVADRNEFVHHLLPSFKPDSIESCLEVDQLLNQQREKLVPEIESLKRMVDTLQRGKQLFAEFLSSDEFQRHLELIWLRESRLVRLLGEIAAQSARPDGWTSLNTAGQLIRQQEPEEITNLKTRYGYKTLKRLILATELFDINEELTQNGGIRVLYRLKTERDY